MRFQNHLCAPNKDELKEKILAKAHNTQYFARLEGTKMYRDLKQYFWWDNTKKEIIEYVDWCLTYQRVKARSLMSNK